MKNCIGSSRVARCLLRTATLGYAFVAPEAAWGQATTSGLRGAVTDDLGTAVVGARVELTHGPSGGTRAATTNASGAFAFTGLKVGGPYVVDVSADGFAPRRVEGILLRVGKNERVRVMLQPQIEQIVVHGSSTLRSTSSRSLFNAQDMELIPSMGRDPKDIVRLVPTAYVDSSSEGLSLGGANNRFNSITVDGIRQDDDFGLNNNGYPTQRSPISMLAVEQIAVELSPFSVTYGGFLGGNVNIVTKSGANAFHGSVLLSGTYDSLTGNRSQEEELKLDFWELSYGASLGGPILDNAVRFFVAIEGLNATTPSGVGPAGSGATNEVAAVSAEDVSRAHSVARDVYGFQAGSASRSLDEQDMKILGKLDWRINQGHRVTGSYQHTRGNRVRDAFFSDTHLALTSNWYNKRESLHAYSLRLFSDWTAELTTELELSGKRVTTRQVPLNGRDFMAALIRTEQGGELVLGPDIYRHANRLDNNLLHFKIKADYLLFDHLLTAGWEHDYLRIFNLFVPSSRGSAEYASLEDFARRHPESLVYQNAISNDARDAAARWGYGVNTFYLQDEVELTEELTAHAGIRHELYWASNSIKRNQWFEQRHGFTNTSTLDGRQIVMPRAALSYVPLDGLNLRGGVGLFSGGTPNVWVSNNYSTDGVSVDQTSEEDPLIIHGFNGRDIPLGLQDALIAGDGNVNVLDPDFRIPSTWKVNIGLDHAFDLPLLGDGFELTADLVYSRIRHGLMWKDLRRDHEAYESNQPVGTLPDGRPYYGEDFHPWRGYDLMLTNTRKGHGVSASLGLQKRFALGLTLSAAYAHQRSREIHPGTSSVASSNYGNVAVIDPEKPELARSNYERTHRVIGAIRFSRPLLADLVGIFADRPPALAETNTSVSVFFESRSGQPYSYTMGGRASDLGRLFGEAGDFARRRRMLLYVPKRNDPNVILDGINEADLDAFIRERGLQKYRGGIAPRNALSSPWLHRVDVRLRQDLPHFLPGHRAAFVVDIENLGNLLNKSWGRYEQVRFPYMVRAIDVDVDRSTGKYVYSNLNTEKPEQVNLLASVWRVQMSVLYEF